MSETSFSHRNKLQSPESEPLTRNYQPDAFNNHIEPVFQSKGVRKKRFSGWRGGLILATTVLGFVLTLNVVVSIIAAVKWKSQDNIATAFTGDCALASRWVTALHLIVNALSTLLLGASNYCIQRLVAPTRGEVDEAHAQNKWLDIGRPSIKNLTSINSRRLLLIIFLAATSFPIHLLYNSTFFLSIGSYQPELLPVNESFFTNQLNSSVSTIGNGVGHEAIRLQKFVLNGQYMNHTAFENVTTAECENRYTAQFVNRGPGFAVVPNFSESGSLSFDSTDTLLNPTNTFSTYSNMSYCLVQKLPPPSCTIQASRTILFVVIGCNIIKLSIMVLVLWRDSDESTLVTIGDAIESFLQRSDPTTENCCLMSRRTIKKIWKAGPDVQLQQRFDVTKKERWFTACSRRNWIVAMFFYCGSIIAAGVFLGFGRHFDGFGKVNLNSLTDMGLPIPGAEISVIPYILSANAPQLVISFIFLLYNGQFTSMLTHREWSNYGVKRAALRVTNPSPNQRSTYYLQLPYAYSIPLLSATTMLHWFVSESYFLVRTQIYLEGKPVNYGFEASFFDPAVGGYYSHLGYSDSAILAGLVLGIMLLLVILSIAFFFKYPIGLPFGGLNSAVISAACHVPTEETEKGSDVTDQPLKWGVVHTGTRDTVGHCSFSSAPVTAPEPGCLYAGTRQRKR